MSKFRILECLRCGFGSGEKKWYPRVEDPIQCPHCHSTKWYIPISPTEKGRKRK